MQIPRNFWRVTARIALALVGLNFLWSAIQHLIGSEWLFEHYENNGIGGKNTWLVGLGQLFAVINLLIPQTQKIAAATVCLIMSLAIVSHLRRGESLGQAWEATPIFSICFVSLIILVFVKK